MVRLDAAAPKSKQTPFSLLKEKSPNKKGLEHHGKAEAVGAFNKFRHIMN
jgi:hypothetical protein